MSVNCRSNDITTWRWLRQMLNVWVKWFPVMMLTILPQRISNLKFLNFFICREGYNHSFRDQLILINSKHFSLFLIMQTYATWFTYIHLYVEYQIIWLYDVYIIIWHHLIWIGRSIKWPYHSYGYDYDPNVTVYSNIYHQHRHITIHHMPS